MWAQCFPGMAWASAYCGGSVTPGMHTDGHMVGADALIYMVRHCGAECCMARHPEHDTWRSLAESFGLVEQESRR